MIRYEEFKEVLPGLVNGYRASEETARQIGGVIMLMMIGPSGAGKTSIMRELGYPFVRSDTTREPRVGEVNGRDYNFRTDLDVLLTEVEKGEFVQIAAGPAGDFYGTKASSHPRSDIATMAVTARAVPLFRNLGFEHTISAVVTPPSYDEWLRRIKSHGLNGDQLRERTEEACESLSLMLNDPRANFILNDRVYDATIQVRALVEGPKVNYFRDSKARKASKSILQRLA
ncbi:hypothetical protein HYS42_01660 [Candidatus Saccharibacteria bacterium]|nr:hypothetical protein [Candidatus Saccharibacteria bacterium]